MLVLIDGCQYEHNLFMESLSCAAAVFALVVALRRGHANIIIFLRGPPVRGPLIISLHILNQPYLYKHVANQRWRGGFNNQRWRLSLAPAWRPRAAPPPLIRNPKSYPHPRLQDFPRQEKTQKKQWITKNSLAAGIRG